MYRVVWTLVMSPIVNRVFIPNGFFFFFFTITQTFWVIERIWTKHSSAWKHTHILTKRYVLRIIWKKKTEQHINEMYYNSVDYERLSYSYTLNNTGIFFNWQIYLLYIIVPKCWNRNCESTKKYFMMFQYFWPYSFFVIIFKRRFIF